MARGLIRYNGWYKLKKEEGCLSRNDVDMRRSGAWPSLLFQNETSLEVCFSRDLKRKEVEPNQNISNDTTSFRFPQ